MLTALRNTLLLLALTFAIPAFSQGYFHSATGTNLPAEVEGYAFKEAVDLDKATPGAGTGIRYTNSGYLVSLFISNLPGDQVSEKIDSPSFMAYRDMTTSAILNAAKAKSPLARKVISMPMSVKTTDSIVTVQFDMFRVYIDEMATNDFQYIWVAKNQFWRLRMTRIPGQSPPFPEKFMEELVRASTAK